VPKYEWFQAPDDLTLGDRKGWHQVGKHNQLFAAGRVHILVVKNTSSEFKDGPVIIPTDLPVGAEASISEKQISVTTHSATLRRASPRRSDRKSHTRKQRPSAANSRAGSIPSRRERHGSTQSSSKS
jgi:hypothetical protein